MSELNEAQKVAWAGFVAGDWQENVNVRDFIQKNYTCLLYTSCNAALSFLSRILKN